jgi:hypothetical protein
MNTFTNTWPEGHYGMCMRCNDCGEIVHGFRAMWDHLCHPEQPTTFLVYGRPRLADVIEKLGQLRQVYGALPARSIPTDLTVLNDPTEEVK